jgi:branched-subunit amino acid ABC-type transport system permease component
MEPNVERSAVLLTSGRLAALSIAIALGAIGAYLLLFRLAAVRNHPEGYVVAFAAATALAVLALVRSRRWPAWLALGLTTMLLAGGVWFNFVVARLPATPTMLRVGDQPPEFTLLDAAGRPVSLADYRGKKPVVVIFYRGYW